MAFTYVFRLHLISCLLYFLSSRALGQTSSEALIPCLQREGLQFNIPSDPTWTTAITATQLRVPREPVAVVFARDRDDISTALSCARNASIKVTILNRRHNFQGYEFGKPGNLAIDLSSFTALSYNNSTQELTVGGGCNVGLVAKYLWDNYRRHVPHVRAGEVGLVGSMMGVGYGTTVRMFGTPVDAFASVDLMLANGSVVTAGQGSDLLWALSGAGPSFGVVLQATISTHAVPQDGALNYTLSLGSNLTVDTVASAVLIIQEFALDNRIPSELSLRFMLGNARSVGYFYGQEAAFDQAMAPLVESLRSVAPNVTLTKNVFASFWESEVASAGISMNATTRGGPNVGRFSHIQSWVTQSQHPLTLEQVTSLFKCYRSNNRTDLTNSGFLDLWGGDKVRPDDSGTSALQGDGFWIIRIDGTGNNSWPSDGVRYMQDLMRPFTKLLEKSAPLRSFPNYADTGLLLDQWSSMMFGDNFPRLQDIKAAVDRNQVFSGYDHAIPLPSLG